MEKPNLMESVEPHSGQYSFKADLRLNAWLAVATLVYLMVRLVLHQHSGWPPALRGGLALTPLIPGLLYLSSWVRFVRGLDELQRRIQVEAFFFAALGTLVTGVALSILNAEGIAVIGLRHGLGLGATFLVMLCLWSLGWGIAKCRYQ